LRTGKCLSKKWTGVVIEFKAHQNQSKLGIDNVNRLLIEIAPNEKIEFYLLTKKGGKEMEFVPLTTGKPIYCSGDCLNEHSRLFLDVIRGDRLLFLDFAEIYEAWKTTDVIADLFEQNLVELDSYEKGSVGPAEADEMLAKDGFKWFNDF
jgi:glucose-6-phosphate 1-dehydrogenase